ncbi:DJ-1/PfpI family protein [candidate division KSB1 bacterium]
MRIKFLSLMLLTLIFCSKNTNSPEEYEGDAKFRILALDNNNEAYASGMGKIVVELNENKGNGNIEPVEKTFLISLNGAGVGEFVFKGQDLADHNDNIKIKEVSVLNHVFEEVGKTESEIIVGFGKMIYETVNLDVECKNVFWERLDFRREFDLSGIKVLIIVGRDFDYNECMYISNYLEYYGAEVKIASCLETIQGHDIDIPPLSPIIYTNYSITVDILLDDVNLDDYDCLFFPGGSGPANMLNDYPQITDLVVSAYNKNILIAAICHGPLVLAEAGILNGIQATGYEDTQDTIVNNGGIYVTEKIVVSGRVITGNWPYFNTMATTIAEHLQN